MSWCRNAFRVNLPKLRKYEKGRSVWKIYIIGLQYASDIVLEVFVDPNHPQHNTKPEALGLRHLCFVVDDLSKVDVECEEIRTDWFGRRFTFCRDYDGQPIELKEKKCEGPHE